MKTVGIICEYNPLHLGHQKQIRLIREHYGPECAIVCLMSGNFVQRGAPAVFDKSLRAKAAVLSGADLVLELPLEYALSSAEGFAAGGVEILSGFCEVLSFGTESGDRESLMETAEVLLSPRFPEALREKLDEGLSFPVARQAALETMNAPAVLLDRPNDILAVEYCKAIMNQGSSLDVFPVIRQGNYHDLLPDRENRSATSLRRCLASGEDWLSYVPTEAADCFREARVHTLAAGERAVLARLRSMTEGEFEALPYGNEGLWRKFMFAARQYGTVEEILTAVKSKRYTRSRLDRMLLCAFLGMTAGDLAKKPPYIRVLALNDRGRTVLKRARQAGQFLNAGQIPTDAYWETERRAGDLYGLFCNAGPERAGAEENRRVCYCPDATFGIS